MCKLITYIKVLLSVKFLLATLICYSQIGIGTEAPDSSAELDVFSENKGILIPRLTSKQISDSVTHEDALLVYNTSAGHFMLSLDTAWYVLNPWKGNEGKIYTETKKVGIGVENPVATLDINGELKINKPIETNNNSGTIYFNADSGYLMVHNGIDYYPLVYDTDMDGIIDKCDSIINDGIVYEDPFFYPKSHDRSEIYVRLNKTYWDNGRKKTGTMQTYTNYVTPIVPASTEKTSFLPGYYNSFIIEGDADLIPENIKIGINIFNVNGTYNK